MTSADDLGALFDPPPPGPAMVVSYRQGVVVEFDPNTLANKVDVGGTVLDDLPLLGVGEARLLVPGSVVGIQSATSARGAATWAITGRLVFPNTPDAGQATSLLNSQVISASVAAEESASSLLYDDLATVGPEVEVNVGASGRLLVLITTQINWIDTDTTTAEGGFATIEMSEGNTMDPVTAEEKLVALLVFGISPIGTLLIVNSATATCTFEGLTPGLTKLRMKYRCGGSVPASFARRTLVVVAL